MRIDGGGYGQRKSEPIAAPRPDLTQFLAKGRGRNDLGWFNGISKRFIVLEPEDAAELRTTVAARVLSEVTRSATCETRSLPETLAAARGLSQLLGITPAELQAASQPVWNASYGDWFAKAFATATDELSGGRSSKAVSYVERVGELHPSVRHNVPDAKRFLVRLSAAAVEQLLRLKRTEAMLESLKRSASQLDVDDPNVLSAVRDALSRCAAEELARGFTVDTTGLAAWGVHDIAPAPALEPFTDSRELYVRVFPEAMHEPVRRCLADHPDMARGLADMLRAAENLTPRELVWLVNRSRPATDPYRAELPAVSETRDVDSLKKTLAALRHAPLVRQSVSAAFSQPDMLAQLGAYLTHAPTREALTIAVRFDGLESPAGDKAFEVLDDRRAATADRMDRIGAAALAERLRRTTWSQMKRVEPTVIADVVTPAANERALAYVAAGERFLGSAMDDARELRALFAAGDSGFQVVSKRLEATLETKLEELLSSRALTDDDAAACASLLNIGGGMRTSYDEDDNDVLVHGSQVQLAVIKAIRLTNGEAMTRLGSVAAGRRDERAHFSTMTEWESSGDIVAPAADSGAAMHEAGHGWEHARPELFEAARALRAQLALSTTAYGMRELAVVRRLANYAGDDAHERLLRHFCANATSATRLDSADAIRAIFSGCGIEAAIDRLCDGGHMLQEVRGYGEHEIALPLVGEPYAGKLYDESSTEMVSLGLESLDSSWRTKEALLADPKRTAFIVGAVLASSFH